MIEQKLLLNGYTDLGYGHNFRIPVVVNDEQTLMLATD